MEKYAVEEEESNIKAANKVCPKCGSDQLIEAGPVTLCPKCGSEPFEKREQDK